MWRREDGWEGHPRTVWYGMVWYGTSVYTWYTGMEEDV